MSHSVLVFVLVVLVPVYSLWRYWCALKVRAMVVDDVDAYLGQGGQEPLKQLVHHVFGECLHMRLPYYVVVGFVFANNRHGLMVSKIKLDSGTDEFKRADDLLKKVLMVNVTRYPLSWFLCILVAAVAFIFRLTGDRGKIDDEMARFRSAFLNTLA